LSQIPDWETLSDEELQSMAVAGHEVLNCYRVLAKSSDNVIGEILKGEDNFFEMDHYPPGDVYDPESHSQYYYHAHREGEHGHFHTFLRSEGMKEGEQPVSGQSHMDYMEERDDNICHLIAISMDNRGFPINLFTTNRWVTAENWYHADDVHDFLDRFEMDVVPPSWAVNIWLTNIVRLYKPVIVELLTKRDVAIENWQQDHPDLDVFEDRNLEVTSEQDINVEAYLQAVEQEINRRVG